DKGPTMLRELVRRTKVREIIGDVIRIQAPEAALGELAFVENSDGETSLAQVIAIDAEIASLQVYAGGKGLSTEARVRFLGKPLDVPVSANVLGRVFTGAGEPLDARPTL